MPSYYGCVFCHSEIKEYAVTVDLRYSTEGEIILKLFFPVIAEPFKSKFWNVY